ncbi:DUF1176 domain-containing protein [Paucibacter sp. DJ1R-11]|uniref:DUF1176 domain-containing protein n=1 Tax=Paucibacter sp. DJ1R-11 TaxID=2893556 RepID=UPI0021E3892E|nr:DUF1176 domain-containing protein [Paucibacter sp. DJ1R-11]MCV2364784.1 DUF1176 domain-containing protein [Paucibacter sp. DJ1R-11]
MQTTTGTTALLALFALSAAQAQSLTQVHEFKDWAIACDNRRHCEAIAYQSEESGSAPVTMWLSRDAGPHARVYIQLDVDEINEDTKSLTLHLGPRQQLKGISPRKDLSPVDTAKLLAYVLEGEEIVVAEGGSGNSSRKRWQLSLAGSKAALLKMDDLQGRVGTPGALVRRGKQDSKADSSVLPPLAAPKVKAQALPKTSVADRALLQPILDSIVPRDCWEYLPDDSGPEQSLTRVSATEVLVMRECGRGAYQGGSSIWLANSKPPYAPKRLTLPLLGWDSTEDVMNANLTAEGRLSSFAKGRGISDCGSSFDWVWSGRSFELIEAWRSPLCRGFPGGGFGLRVWTAQPGP